MSKHTKWEEWEQGQSFKDPWTNWEKRTKMLRYVNFPSKCIFPFKCIHCYCTLEACLTSNLKCCPDCQHDVVPVDIEMSWEELADAIEWNDYIVISPT